MYYLIALESMVRKCAKQFAHFGHVFFRSIVFSSMIRLFIVLAILATNFSAAIPVSATGSVAVAQSTTSLERQNNRGPLANSYQAPEFVHPLPRKIERVPNLVAEDRQIRFIENIGQFEGDFQYVIQGATGSVFFASDAIWFSVIDDSELVVQNDQNDGYPFRIDSSPRDGASVKISFKGANPNAKLEGFDPIDSSINYITDSTTIESVPVWAGIRYSDIFPGVDLEVTSRDGVWIWTFVADSFGQLQSARMKIQGATNFNLLDGIAIFTSVEDWKLPALRAQDPTGRPLIIPGGRRANANGDEFDVPFDNSEIDKDAAIPLDRRARGLVVPENAPLAEESEILFSMFLGGSSWDIVEDVATDPSGNIYVAGSTKSINFPTSFGAYRTSISGGEYVFVSKFSSNGGGLFYSTYVGELNDDACTTCDGNGISIEVNDNGEAFVTGYTNATTFPTTSGALQETYGGGAYDAFLFKLNQTGTGLLFSTYVGGSRHDDAHGIAIDSSGDIYITGLTASSEFSTTVGAYDPAPIFPEISAFVAKFSGSTGSLIYSTCIDGPGGLERGYAIAVNSSGEAVIGGWTQSDAFPTTSGVVQESMPAGIDFHNENSFVTKLNATGSGLVFSTYLGGGEAFDIIYALALDIQGNIYVGGRTYSNDYPTTSGAFQEECSYCDDQASGQNGAEGFISKLDPLGESLIYSSFLGGAAGGDTIMGIAVDGSQRAYLTGVVWDTAFPVTADAFQTTTSGTDPVDGFISVVSNDGATLSYSSYFGGTDADWVNAIALGFDNDPIFAGFTFSEDFPLQGGYGYPFGGTVEGFLANVHLDIPGPIMNVLPDSVRVSSGAYLDFPGIGVAASADQEGCDPLCQTQVFSEKPINVLTGVFSHGSVDISFPTAMGVLAFQRMYISSLASQEPGALGYGWVSNHEARLILPDDPEGIPGQILFQDIYGNIQPFQENPDGTYTGIGGFTATIYVDSWVPYELVMKNQNIYDFDEEGKLLYRFDGEGNEINYFYNPDGTLARVQDLNGDRFLEFSYDPQGRVTAVEDHAARTVSYTYSVSGDLQTVTNLLGDVWTYVYDSEHRLIEIQDPSAITVLQTDFDLEGRAYRQFDAMGNKIVEIAFQQDGSSIVYDANNNVMIAYPDTRGTVPEIEDATGASVLRGFDNNLRVAEITDELGHVTELLWSNDGKNLTKVTNALGEVTLLAYDYLNNVTSVVDARGFLTTFNYEYTLLSSSIDALSNETTYTYTPEGFLSTVTDARGYTTTYTYNDFGQMTSVTNALGHITSFDYDSVGRLTDVTDDAGRVTHNEYDAAGRLTRVTNNYDVARTQNEDGVWNIVTEFSYDERGNLVSQTDTLGRMTQFVYDAADRLIQTIDPDNNSTLTSFDDYGNVVSSTDALGRTTTYGYDSLNRLVTTTDPLGNTTTTTYNLDGTVASTTDALSHSRSYTYDSLKRVITVTDHQGNVTTNTYDEAGNVESTTDARGNTTFYEYDALGQLILQTAADGGETEFFYDENGNRIQTIDARGYTTTYTYDALNRVATINDALGNVTSFAYDNLGNRISVTDPRGNTTQFVYDKLNRLVETIDALQNSSTTEYDALGRVTANTDPLNRTTTYAYDILDRLVSQTNPLSGVISFTYDAAGNQLTVTDPRGSTTTTAYDALNRPVTVVDPNSNSSATVYNAVGNVLSVSDGLGNTTNFTYDVLNRQISATNPNGDSISYSYDANGNRVTVTDSDGTVTRFEYDAINRLTAVVENYLPGQNPDHETNVRTEYSYDLNGNRLTITDGNEHVTSFTYDSLNRLISEADALGNTWTNGYDASGNRVSLLDANGALVQYSYDALNRLVAINYPNPDPDVAFTYDAAGQRTTLIDGLGTTTWTYDGLGRPTAIEDPFDQTVGYGYDPAGNLTSLTYPDSKVVSYAYDAASRLTSLTDWDAQSTTYTYDAANRLATASRPNAVVSNYIYNPAGQLLSLTHSDASETELASFVYQYDVSGNRVSATEVLLQPAVSALNQSPVASSVQGDVGEMERDALISYALPVQQDAETETPTDIPTATETIVAPATNTSTATSTSTIAPIATATPVASTATNTASVMPTATFAATTTETPAATGATLETGTATSTGTPSPSATTTVTPTVTTTETVTATPTAVFRYEGVLVVNSTADTADINPGDQYCDDGTGQCTLRAAIQEANALKGNDAIQFDIPGDGPHWITLLSELPAIVDATVIDASSQPGYTGNPLIVLNGQQAGDWANGLVLESRGSLIRALAIVNFSRAGVYILGDNNSVESSFLGTGPSGTDDLGNTMGILVEGPNNLIRDNLVSGNEFGIYLYENEARANQIVGNRIGTDISGTLDLGNGVGIRVNNAGENRIGGNRPGEGNLISANGMGIVIQGETARANGVFGNALGVDGSGSGILGNHQIGIWVYNAVANQIGGRGAGNGNRIEGSPEALRDQGTNTLIEGNQFEELYPDIEELEPVLPDLLPDIPVEPQITPTPTPDTSSLVVRDSTFYARRTIASEEKAAIYSGQTFVVNSTGDGADANLGDGVCADSSGNCTLRAAIQEANQDTGGDTIEFAIAGAGPHTISPTTKLPTITGVVLIDGTTQTGYSATTPMIVLDGAGAGAAAVGLDISAGNSTVRGLVIVGHDGSGLVLKVAGANNITGNFIGIGADGETANSNWRGITVAGSDGNLIGGNGPEFRNLISGNETTGIFLEHWSVQFTTNTVIAGNFVGTDFTGAISIPNAQYGVYAGKATGTQIGGEGEDYGNLISGNGSDGIYLSSVASGTAILGNIIGTDLTGTQDLGNGRYGIAVVSTANTTIGGTATGAGNLVSGNGSWGIYLASNTSNAVIQGNFIGTDATGSYAISNYQYGIEIRSVSNVLIGGTDEGAGNLISGNTSMGIRFSSSGGSNITIQGNFIGTNASGSAAIPNGYLGISPGGNHTNMIIGGSQPGAGNVISGNSYAGIQVSGTGELLFEGNLVGTNSSGTGAIPNGYYGLIILNSSSNFLVKGNLFSGNTLEGLYSAGPGLTISENKIGTDITGTVPVPNGTYGLRVMGANTIVINNLISGNGSSGVQTFSGALNSIFRGNIIGLDITGQNPLPNSGSGISVNSTSGIIIGGDLPGEGNHIAFNGADGVTIVGSSTSLGNFVTGNSIHNNGSVYHALGIDLVNQGVTPNDLGDVDTGVNGLQNFPVLTASTSDATSFTSIDGTLNSIADTEFRVEFFANQACDTSGKGEGQFYLGHIMVTTDSSGNVTFSETLDTGALAGMTFITSTATDPIGSTSEFSGCVEATIVPAVVEYSWEYEYDPLNRLVYACSEWNTGTEDCDGEEFEYTYDAVGNRLTQTINGLAINYVYDDANRLTSVAGQAYTWDANGNLLSDGTSSYTYDHANRLVGVSQSGVNYAFAYNGKGDRLQQTVDGITTNYTLNLAGGLTQVLADGTSTYLYGLGRIGEESAQWAYHLGDALGSVRQLVGADGSVTLAQSYEPYGSVLASGGGGGTSYGFTGEWTDATGLVHLRARYYALGLGRFVSRDIWGGNQGNPISMHKWIYGENSPVVNTDPSGYCVAFGWDDQDGLFTEENCDRMEAGDLEFIENWYYQFADYVEVTLPQTAHNMRHYLDGTGQELHLEPNFMANDIYGWSEVRQEVDSLVGWYINSKLNDLDICSPEMFGPDVYVHGFTPPYYQALPFWPNRSQLDIAGSLGSFRLDVEIQGELHRIANRRIAPDLKVRLVVLDLYNWHGGLSVYYELNQIQDSWAHSLELAGMAKSYLVRGDFVLNFTDTRFVWPFGNTGSPPGQWVYASCIGSQFDIDQQGPGKVDYCGNPMRE